MLTCHDASGEPLATLVNFAAHPTVLDADNPLVSRDGVGYAVDSIEAQSGAPAVFFNGIEGDVSPPVPAGTYADDFARAAAYGAAIAEASRLAGEELVELGDLEVVEFVEWEQEIDNPTLEVLLALTYDELRSDEADRKYITLGATYFRFGDSSQGLSFPGEALTRLGLDLKAQLVAPHRLFLGLTDDTIGYFVSADEWEEAGRGGYEESASVHPEAGENARREILSLIAADRAAN